MHSWLKSLLITCSDMVSIGVHPLSKVLSRSKIRILCYHRVCDLPSAKDYEGHVSVSPEGFARQMEFLKKQNFNVISLNQLVEYKDTGADLPPKTVVITFDDGYRDNFVHAFPILKRLNLKATFFVVTEYIDTDRIFDWLMLEKESIAHSEAHRELWVSLTSEEMVSMMPGVSFGSHSKSHCLMSRVDQIRAKEEIIDSKECLEKITSRPVISFSYPYGELSESVKSLVVAAGYKVAVTDRRGTNTLNSDFYELRRTSISSRDSFPKFKRKVEGAYDWALFLAEIGRTVAGAISHSAGE